MRDARQIRTDGAICMARAGMGGTMGLAQLERLFGLAIAAGAIGLAAPALAGDLTITPSVEVREAFSDNVDLGPDGAEVSALTSEVVPGVSIRSESARVTAALNAFPILRHQTAGEDKGLSLAGDLAGLGTVEVAEDLFFVDGQASIMAPCHMVRRLLHRAGLRQSIETCRQNYRPGSPFPYGLRPQV